MEKDTMKDAIAHGIRQRESNQIINGKEPHKVREKALACQLADRSDPFVYRRIMSHCVSGFALATDYAPNQRP